MSRLNTPAERRSPPRMEVLGRNMNAWDATTCAHIERMSGKYKAVLTAWDKATDTWKVCVLK